MKRGVVSPENLPPFRGVRSQLEFGGGDRALLCCPSCQPTKPPLPPRAIPRAFGSLIGQVGVTETRSNLALSICPAQEGVS